MARFSLSPPSAKPTVSRSLPQATDFKWNFPPRSPFEDDTSQDETSCSSQQDDGSHSIDRYSDSSEEADPFEEEPPHPLGFELYGRTRFGLSASSCVHIKATLDENNIWIAPVHISPLHDVTSCDNRLIHHGISPSTLIRGITENQINDVSNGGMDRIENLLRAASLHDAPHKPIQLHPSLNNSKLLALARAAEHELESTSHQMSLIRDKQSESYQNGMNALKLLLEADKASVAEAQQRMDKRLAWQQQQEDELQRELRKQQEEERAAMEELERFREVKARQAQEEQLAQEERRKHQIEQIKAAEDEAIEEAKMKNAHVSRARKLVSQLNTTIRPRLSNFDKSKIVSRRRLGFKKIVNGKINTLSHDESKIKEVGGMVVEAVQNAQKDDEAATDEVSKLGKQYLLDLLASTLIVRVQADGFNGTRGDGFPLAAAFALISMHCEELDELLQGHLYGVCPMGVPVLEMEEEVDREGSTGDSSDDRWMESLGMIRDKNGEFESFDKFLHRTEGLISVVANIMSSLPTNHTLLGGHQGALIWLERFIDLLPPPPSKPLPLLTAPVLVAFLTGAGHMLAHKFEVKFKALFTTIVTNIMDRLDDSPVGVPSATRLKKVVEGGFTGLKKNLPAGAIESLYDGMEGIGTASITMPTTSSSSGGAFGTSQKASMNSTPFGQGSTGAATFGQAASNVASFSQPSSSAPSFSQNPASTFGQAAASPFNQTATTTSSGFGNTPTNQSTNPFGQTATVNEMMDSGGATSGGQATFSASSWGNSGFAAGSTSFQSQSNTFGGSAPSSTPFSSASSNPSPFGSQQINQASPFGGGISAAPAPSPFGGSVPASSPFGSFSSQQPGNNPFGGGALSSNQGNATYSSSGSSTFGNSNSGNVKKDTRPPCRFFSKGNCRYGANCKFSHGDSGSTGNNNASAFASSFGGGGGGFGSQNQNTFNPSPFSGGNAGFSSNPFGGPRR